MSNNELYEHKRSDTVKWVLTLFAFILVGVMLAGIILGWFDKKEEPPAEEEQTEQAAVMDGEGNAMDEDTIYPMPEKMSFLPRRLRSRWRSSENRAALPLLHRRAWTCVLKHTSTPKAPQIRQSISPLLGGTLLRTVASK